MFLLGSASSQSQWISWCGGPPPGLRALSFLSSLPPLSSLGAFLLSAQWDVEKSGVGCDFTYDSLLSCSSLTGNG